MTPPPVTVLMGAHTVQGVALAEMVRDTRFALADAGVGVGLQRQAKTLVEPALAAGTDAARAALLARFDAMNRVFLCHLNGFGRLETAVDERVLYPGIEAGAGALARLFPAHPLRVIIAIAPLDLFFGGAFGKLARRVRKSRWERIYDLSWADRLEMVEALLPETAEVLVLTPEGCALAGDGVAETVFGTAVGSGRIWLERELSEAGQLALAEAAEVDPAALLAAYPRPVDPDGLAAMGIDRSLAALLRDRYAEDLARLADMDRISLL